MHPIGLFYILEHRMDFSMLLLKKEKHDFVTVNSNLGFFQTPIFESIVVSTQRSHSVNQI